MSEDKREPEPAEGEDFKLVSRALRHLGTNPPPPAEIAAALATLRVAAVGKSKQAGKGNDSWSYKFAGHGELIAEVQTGMAEVGLSLVVQGWETIDGDPPLAELNAWLVHTSGVSWRLCDKNGNGPRMPVLEGKGRPLDKATAAALTYCQRYVNLLVPGVPRVDDDTEVNRRNDAHHEPRRMAQQPEDLTGWDGTAVVSGGKHKGKLWSQLSHDYLTWAVEEGPPNVKRKAEAEVERRIEAEADRPEPPPEPPPASDGES